MHDFAPKRAASILGLEPSKDARVLVSLAFVTALSALALQTMYDHCLWRLENSLDSCKSQPECADD